MSALPRGQANAWLRSWGGLEQTQRQASLMWHASWMTLPTPQQKARHWRRCPYVLLVLVKEQLDIVLIDLTCSTDPPSKRYILLGVSLTLWIFMLFRPEAALVNTVLLIVDHVHIGICIPQRSTLSMWFIHHKSQLPVASIVNNIQRSWQFKTASFEADGTSTACLSAPFSWSKARK